MSFATARYAARRQPFATRLDSTASHGRAHFAAGA
jgi:hypothetical protein